METRGHSFHLFKENLKITWFWLLLLWEHKTVTPLLLIFFFFHRNKDKSSDIGITNDNTYQHQLAEVMSLTTTKLGLWACVTLSRACDYYFEVSVTPGKLCFLGFFFVLNYLLENLKAILSLYVMISLKTLILADLALIN